MKQLSSLAGIQTGYARGRVEDNPQGAFCVVSQGDITEEGDVRTDNLPRTDDLDPSEHHVLVPGDVLFVPRGTSHPAALVGDDLGRAVASSQLYVLRTGEALLPGFLAWYLNQERAQTYFSTLGRGTNIQSVNKKILGELSVPVPPRERQRAIAHVAALSRREADLARRIHDCRRTLIQHLLLEAAT
jgi:restriction endonuclease S subunit